MLLFVSIINNLIMYYSSYHYKNSKDPLLPNNIGVLKYNVYYNIKTTQSTNKESEYYSYDNNSGISIKNDIDKTLNNYQNKNIGKCLIVIDNPNSEDYQKILKISKTD